MAFETLEKNARQTTSDVMICMKKILSALEAREQELLTHVDKVKNLKLQNLQARHDQLKYNINRLTKITEKLSDNCDLTAAGNNPLNLLVTKDIAMSEVIRIISLHLNK